MTPKDDPSVESPAVARMRPKWQRCRDVRGGTDVFRDKRSEYLPKFAVEDAIDWAARVAMTFVVDFFDQALAAMVGLGLRHDPELGKDVPEQLKKDWENLDGEGNHGSVVLGRAFDAALQDGHHVLFVDYPRVSGTLNLAQEQELGVQPYVIRIGVDQIVSWRTVVRGGRKLVSQFVWKETSQEADGLFTTKEVVRYRVYRLTDTGVEWEVWQQSGEQKELVRTEGPSPLVGPKEIPLAVVYGGMPTAILESTPPLDGLAQSNIRWGQVMSDRARSLHLTGIPIPVLIGHLVGEKSAGTSPSTPITISTNRPMQVDTGGDFKFAEISGTSLEQARLELQDWEQRMGTQALSLFQPAGDSAETATESRRQRAKEESKISRALRSLEDAGELVLHYMAQYRKLPTDKCELTIRRDFGDVLSIELLRLLSELADKRQLTLVRLLTEIKRAGAVGTDFEPEAEADALEQEATSGDGLPDLVAVDDATLEAQVRSIAAELERRRGGQQSNQEAA